MLFSLLAAALAPLQTVSLSPPLVSSDDPSTWVQTELRPTSDRLQPSWLMTAATSELAARLLPESVAGTVTSHQIAEGRPGEPPRMVLFHTDPAPVGVDACRRATYEVPLRLAGDLSAVRGTRVISRLELALAPACRGEAGWRMARVSVSHRAGALEALRWLQHANQQAAGEAPLPFEVTCSSYRPEPCAPEARAVLAALPLHQAYEVSAYHDQWTVTVTPGRPEDLHWRVRILRPTSGPASVHLAWTSPAPF